GAAKHLAATAGRKGVVGGAGKSNPVEAPEHRQLSLRQRGLDDSVVLLDVVPVREQPAELLGQGRRGPQLLGLVVREHQAAVCARGGLWGADGHALGAVAFGDRQDLLAWVAIGLSGNRR